MAKPRPNLSDLSDLRKCLAKCFPGEEYDIVVLEESWAKGFTFTVEVAKVKLKVMTRYREYRSQAIDAAMDRIEKYNPSQSYNEEIEIE